MEYLKSTLLIACIAGLGLAATVVGAVTPVNSKITAVTVFGDRALVTRTSEITLSSGANHLVFNDIPIAADENSIQARVMDNQSTVLGMTHKTVTAALDSSRILRLNQTLDTLYNHKLAALNDRKSVLEQQKSMLDQLIANAGKTLSDDMSKVAFDAKNWEQAYTFISRNLSSVVDSLRGIGLESAGISNRCSKLEVELAQLKNAATQQTRQVTVDVEVESAGRSQIAIVYLVPQASWSPIYNARLVDSGRVELSYFGQVVQRTGEDWNDVKLTLSTASPSRIMTPGELSAKTLVTREGFDLEFGGIQLRGGRGNEQGTVTAERDLLRITETANLRQIRPEGIMNTPVSTVSELQRLQAGTINGERGLIAVNSVSSSLSTNFIVLQPETIPSGDQSTRTAIAQWVIDGSETLIARPQNCLYVFRFMNLKNTTGAPLLPGTINLFAQNDYVGQFESPDLILPDEEFEMPFGIDDGIEIKREISNRLNSIDGDKRSLSETINITLINKSGVDRTVDLEEAFITSNDSRVKVDIKSVTPKPNETDLENKAKWRVRLVASAKEVVSISYKVEYPRTIQLSGL